MAYKIIIKEAARLDTEDAYKYYENEREGLGEEFLQELIKKYDCLYTHPQHYGFTGEQYIFRDIKLDRFPYSIVYEMIEDSVIIYSIHNNHRPLKKRVTKG